MESFVNNNIVPEVEYETEPEAGADDVWDDYAILKAFDQALKQDTKKKTKKKKTKSPPPSPKEENVPPASNSNVQYDDKTYETAYAHAYADIYNQYQRPAMEATQQPQQPAFNVPQPPPSMTSACPVPVPGNQEQLSQMLMAWYYSGYYTGKYQAHQELQQRSQAVPTPQFKPPFPF